MKWTEFTDMNQLDALKQPFIIFKHSTRCPISGMAKRNVELEADMIPDDVPAFFLDLIKHRDLSNQIAERYSVRHESPQLLLISEDHCAYHASHGDISVSDVVSAIAAL